MPRCGNAKSEKVSLRQKYLMDQAKLDSKIEAENKRVLDKIGFKKAVISIRDDLLKNKWEVLAPSDLLRISLGDFLNGS